MGNSPLRKAISNILDEYNFDDAYLNDEFDTCLQIYRCKKNFLTEHVNKNVKINF